MIFYSEQVTMSSTCGSIVLDISPAPTTSSYTPYIHHSLELDPNSLEALLNKALEIPRFREDYISAMKEFAPLARTLDDEPTLMSLRMERGITRQEMAQALGISDRLMCEFESGNSEKMTWGQMHKLSQVLACEIGALVRLLSS